MKFKKGDKVRVKANATCHDNWRGRPGTVGEIDPEANILNVFVRLSSHGTKKADSLWFYEDQLEHIDPRITLLVDVDKAVKAFEAARNALLDLGCTVEATITSPPEVRTYK